ncbi:MAG: hypothetical protein JO317_00585, partial [Verrucomicrobiae bacterium]|nr:hypothetical protein [Verrucomicrobiae bacterium]
AYNNPCGVPNDLILTNSGTCTFIRNDGISRADYKKFSVREIPPLP